MGFLTNMKTRSKLLLNALIMVMIVAGLGVFVVSRIMEMQSMIKTLYDDRLIPAVDLGKIQGHLGNIRLGALRIITEPDGAKQQNIFNGAANDEKEIDKLIEKYGATSLASEEKKVFEEFKTAWKAYNSSRLNTYNLAMEYKLDEAQLNAATDAALKYKAADEKAVRLIAIQGEIGKDLYKEADDDYMFARNVTIAITIVSILVAVGFGLILSNIIAAPLQHGVKLAEAIKGGDMTNKIEASLMERGDEIGQLMKSLSGMSEKLRGLIGNISQSSNQIASASEELSSTAEQMSRGMQQQTSQTSQIASAMEEMSATVLEVAKNSQSASSSAIEASSTAQRGGEVVTRTISGMMSIAATVEQSARTIGELGKSSDQIGEIVAVIDDIADQTNLLALNAAIEAARAGEQGRGFAVVADEVRKLAERTTKATKEIAQMIKTIQKDTGSAVAAMDAGTKEVKEGVDLANQAGESLVQIVDAVHKVNDMIRQIATAAEEQSNAAEEISKSVEEIASITKETSSGSNQTATASHELSKMATELQGTVGQFKI